MTVLIPLGISVGLWRLARRLGGSVDAYRFVFAWPTVAAWLIWLVIWGSGK